MECLMFLRRRGLLMGNYLGYETHTPWDSLKKSDPGKGPDRFDKSGAFGRGLITQIEGLKVYIRKRFFGFGANSIPKRFR